MSAELLLMSMGPDMCICETQTIEKTSHKTQKSVNCYMYIAVANKIGFLQFKQLIYFKHTTLLLRQVSAFAMAGLSAEVLNSCVVRAVTEILFKDRHQFVRECWYACEFHDG